MTHNPQLPQLLLRLRARAGDDHLLAWLERVDGPAHSCLLAGQLLLQAAEDLAAAFLALGVPVEREVGGRVVGVDFPGGGKAQPTDLFADQEAPPPRPEPEPPDRVKPSRRRKKGEGI